MHGGLCQDQDSLILTERNKNETWQRMWSSTECFKKGECEIKLGYSVTIFQKYKKQVLNDKTEDNFTVRMSDFQRWMLVERLQF